MKAWIKGKLDGIASPSFAFTDLDSKTPFEVKKVANLVIRKVSHKSFNLKPSVPYLPQIMVDFNNHVAHVFSVNTAEQIKANKIYHEYFNIVLLRFFSMSNNIIGLCKTKKIEMADEESPARREFVKMSLICSHLLAEFQVYFAGGNLRSDFKILKPEPREFWEKNFSTSILVDWNRFAFFFYASTQAAEPPGGTYCFETDY